MKKEKKKGYFAFYNFSPIWHSVVWGGKIQAYFFIVNTIVNYIIQNLSYVWQRKNHKKEKFVGVLDQFLFFLLKMSLAQEIWTHCELWVVKHFISTHPSNSFQRKEKPLRVICPIYSKSRFHAWSVIMSKKICKNIVICILL